MTVTTHLRNHALAQFGLWDGFYEIIVDEQVTADTKYIIQSSEFRYGRWTEWSCCSPQYVTFSESRGHYEKTRSCRYVHRRIRLAKSTVTLCKIPGVRLRYNAGSRLHVYESKRLRCYCPPKRKDMIPQKMMRQR